MKTSVKRRFSFWVTVVILTIGVWGAILSCRRNSGISDLVIDPPKETGERQIVVTALNSSTGDSLADFRLLIQTPTEQIEKTVTGKKFILKNPVEGSYSITASLGGYISKSTAFKVTLPADNNTGIVVEQRLPLTKTAPAVSIDPGQGGILTIKSDPEDITSQAIASVDIPAGTDITLEDGSHPNSISMSVTNIPPYSKFAPTEVVNGVKQLNMRGMDIAHGKILVRNLNFEPEGAQFNKPLLVGINIRDVFPSTMPESAKTAHLNDLSFDCVHEDGSIESIAPDHFSADLNTAYFKISHFSDWTLVFKSVSMTFVQFKYSDIQVKSGNCDEALKGKFEYAAHYLCSDPRDEYLTWLISKQYGDVIYRVAEDYDRSAIPGFKIILTWQCLIEEWRLSDLKNGTSRLIEIPVKGFKICVSYENCHNQGGGSI